MKNFLSIGKVSKLKQVSIKSLRYYDEIDILTPALTDPKTGYRYYKEDQLYILDAISLCIELGIPLKDLTNYKTPKNNLDIQRLLGDSKVLAESKIRSMYNKLDHLQGTMNALANKQSIQLPANCHHKTILSRTIMTIPFDEYTDSTHYNPKLLTLFVTAQKLGLAASYPSGLLYDYYKHNITKYVFIHVTPLNHNVASNWGKNIEGIRTIPAGTYTCYQSDTHEIERAEQIFQLTKKHTKDCTIIETDLLKTEKEVHNKQYELQIL